MNCNCCEERVTAESAEGTAAEEPDEGLRRFAEMCREMMSGRTPDCCGPQVREEESSGVAPQQTREET